ncbi:hypothetical protein DXX93_18475 [Thalassotalea euphylliae]|uniref:Transcription elongation factor n=1 Tax=Thalassotalea euphylliae TaxID=1655234 RepID=A0A3E0TVG4_9GAMM|nr:hypothetical protein [Thalassotalea euphylliae]REL28353.1 hypothetical protein DXX93_18475 [Thalassotalea euphylliae]
MNKKDILTRVQAAIEALLTQALAAATQAHNAAIDDQSKAETQYDTLAIEAAYLAEGQSKRIAELKSQLQQLKEQAVEESEVINIGALFSLAYDSASTDSESATKHFYLLPCAAGTCITLANDPPTQLEHTQPEHSQKIYVITPAAPLGRALIGLTVDDDFSLNLGVKQQTGYVVAIY